MELDFTTLENALVMLGAMSFCTLLTQALSALGVNHERGE